MDLVLHIVTWGERCNDGLMDRLLPSLIQGEKASFLRDIDVEISTDDPSKISRSPWYRQLSFFRSLEFFPVDRTLKEPHPRVAAAEQAFVTRNRGRVLLFLPPDMVAAKGSLSRCVEQLTKGYDMAVTTGVRVRDDVPCPIGALPSHLTAWAWKNHHPFTARQVWGAVPNYNHASCLFFPCAAGYVARGYHLTPIALRHDGPPITFKGTVDDDLVAAIPPERTWVATDSDDVAFAEISPPERTLGSEQNRALTVQQVTAFAQRPYIRPINRFFFRHRIVHRLRDGSTDAIDQVLFPTESPALYDGIEGRI